MLAKKDQLNAISWKCEQLGISYGKLIDQFSHHDLMEVYKEYEELLQQRQKQKAECISSITGKQALAKREYKCWNDTITPRKKGLKY